MHLAPKYADVVSEVSEFFADRLKQVQRCGVKPEQVMLDPGIGFGKTIDHNLQLLRGLPTLAALGQPLLIGVSRKAFLGKILALETEERLEGSLAAAVAAALAGANIIRAHDVSATSRAVRVADAIRFGFDRR